MIDYHEFKFVVHGQAFAGRISREALEKLHGPLGKLPLALAYGIYRDRLDAIARALYNVENAGPVMILPEDIQR